MIEIEFDVENLQAIEAENSQEPADPMLVTHCAGTCGVTDTGF